MEKVMEETSHKKIKTKLEQTRQHGIRILIVLFVVGVSVFLGFSPLFKLVSGGVAGSVVGATFGSIFAILMTMFLLNKQTEIEQESKKSERVFDEKVVLYKDILSKAKEMLEDGQIDSKEILALPFTMIQMQMVGGDEPIQMYTEFFEKVNEIFEDSEDEVVQIPEPAKQQVFSLLSRFSVQCRVDLGISDTPIDESIFARTINVVEQSDKAIKGKRDTSKYTFNGKAFPKSRLVQAVVKDYVSKNPNTTFDELKKAFPDEWHRKSARGAVFVRLVEAEKIFNDTGHRRHFFKETDTIQLPDEVIAVSNQWGIGNIGNFVDGSNKNHNTDISK